MKYLKYIILNLSVVSFLACEDQLDIVSQDVLDAEVAIQSLEDLDGILSGAYSVLRRDGLYGESLLFLPDLMADNLRVGDSNGGALRTEANWQYSSGDDIDTWSNAYTLIFRANSVINNTDQFEDGPEKNRILGQALALRALGHFDLLRYYAEAYNRTSTARGVPVVLEFAITQPERSTVAQVYDQIFSDLESARTMLSDVDQDIQESGPYFLDRNAVTALLARVSLYAELWQDAADYASEVMSTRALANPVDYGLMWSDDAAAEVLFSVVYTTPDDGRIATSLFDVTITRSTFTISDDLANLYDAVNDIRYADFVLLNPDSNPGDDVYLPIKYPGRGGERGLNNAKVLRVSEMYLIRAEAYANITGRASDAMADLNALRAARINGYVNENLTGSALADAIQVERRKELAVEGHRWFDLKRTGSSIQRGADCRGLTVNCSLDAGDHRFVFPIPQHEILANPNMMQNDGY